MKKIPLIFGLASVLMVASIYGAPVVLPEANLFSTSFEEPDYLPGTVYGQNGWTRSGTTVDTPGMVIEDGTGAPLSAPDGTQMLQLSNPNGQYGTGPYANLKFTEEAATDRLYFSAVTAFSGSITANTGLISRFYLNNTSDNFYGAAFGIHQQGGELRFFYLNAKNEYVSFGEALAEADTFYRFEADLDITGLSYVVRVYDYEENTLIASTDKGFFRASKAIDINYLRITNSSNYNTNGDNYVTYYDQIWISTLPIPEGSTTALLSSTLLLLIPVRRLFSI